MKIRNTILALVLLFSLSSRMFGQSDDIRIFGYFQNNFHKMNITIGDNKPFWQENSFLTQQLNIFLAKDYGTSYSSFVNLNFTNSYSSALNVGGMNIEEAWFKYSPSSLFTVKAGMLVPRFNNFNEIKNKTVLLPYIFRPLVYESVFYNQFNAEDFVPQTAFLQVYGDVSLSENLGFNYAVFVGNLSSENLLKNTASLDIGNDTSKFKLVGARLGFNYKNLEFGVSGTYDRKNLWAYNAGYAPRMRFGAYANYSVAGFDFESEYIRVYNDLKGDPQTKLNKFRITTPSAPKGFNKYYYHVNLLYNITDQAFAYAGYDYLRTEDNRYSLSGLKQPYVGGGYKLNESIVVKGEYVFHTEIIGANKIDRNDYIVAASIYF